MPKHRRNKAGSIAAHEESAFCRPSNRDGTGGDGKGSDAMGGLGTERLQKHRALRRRQDCQKAQKAPRSEQLRGCVKAG
jgi:hypothetical protein